MDYSKAGVDISAANETLQSVKSVVQSTYNESVLTGFGGFGGVYKIDNINLVSSIDGVGTKTYYGPIFNNWSNLGVDIVNHGINDVIVQGAHPLFFLDAISMSNLNPVVINKIISGMAEACKKANCVLIGGEIAEMPGMFSSNKVDIIGTMIGSVENKNLLPKQINPGDKIIGFPSKGFHTNGFSLIRKIINEKDFNVEIEGKLLKDWIIEPHASYLKLLDFKDSFKALAHITGGGLIGNIPRVLPNGLGFKIKVPVHPLFSYIKAKGDLSESTLLETFNLGWGMIAISNPVDTTALEKAGGNIIGSIQDKPSEIQLKF